MTTAALALAATAGSRRGVVVLTGIRAVSTTTTTTTPPSQDRWSHGRLQRRSYFNSAPAAKASAPAPAALVDDDGLRGDGGGSRPPIRVIYRRDTRDDDYHDHDRSGGRIPGRRGRRRQFALIGEPGDVFTEFLEGARRRKELERQREREGLAAAAPMTVTTAGKNGVAGRRNGHAANGAEDVDPELSTQRDRMGETLSRVRSLLDEFRARRKNRKSTLRATRFLLESMEDVYNRLFVTPGNKEDAVVLSHLLDGHRMHLDVLRLSLKGANACTSASRMGRTLGLMEDHVARYLDGLAGAADAASDDDDDAAAEGGYAAPPVHGGFFPEKGYYDSLLLALSKSDGVDVDGKTSRPPALWAEEILERMETLHSSQSHLGRSDIRPDVVSFNRTISAWANHADRGAGGGGGGGASGAEEAAERAEGLLRLMEDLHRSTGDARVRPNGKSYRQVISAWSRCGKEESGRRMRLLLEEMMEERSLVPDMKTCHMVLSALADSDSDPGGDEGNDDGAISGGGGARDRAEGARDVLDLLIRSGTVRPDVYCHNMVLKACGSGRGSLSTDDEEGRESTLRILLSTFKNLKDGDDDASSREGVCPDEYSYFHFVRACEVLLPAEGDPRRAKLIRGVFRDCAVGGLVSASVLRAVRNALPRDSYEKLLLAASGAGAGAGPDRSGGVKVNGAEGGPRLPSLPPEWSRNVRRRPRGSNRRRGDNAASERRGTVVNDDRDVEESRGVEKSNGVVAEGR